MSVSHVVKGDGKVWPCVLGGVAAGAALAAVALHLMPDCFVPAFCKPRTRHAKVHVLLVQLGFASQADRDSFVAAWSPLAARVHAAEPRCLSYECCFATEDEKALIIYERYRTKADLDGAHQESLKAHRAVAVPGAAPVTKSLTHFTETNIGHMDR